MTECQCHQNNTYDLGLFFFGPVNKRYLLINDMPNTIKMRQDANLSFQVSNLWLSAI